MQQLFYLLILTYFLNKNFNTVLIKYIIKWLSQDYKVKLFPSTIKCKKSLVRVPLEIYIYVNTRILGY